VISLASLQAVLVECGFLEFEASKLAPRLLEDQEIVFEPPKDRVCDACTQAVDDGPDPCIGHVAGVAEACCGHGSMFARYVTKADGTIMRGVAANAELGAPKWSGWEEDRSCDLSPNHQRALDAWDRFLERRRRENILENGEA
jgi:hypothetical protein